MSIHRIVTIKRGGKKYYFTKSRMTQFLYWKILIGTAVLAVCVVGAFQQYTLRYIAGLTTPITPKHFFVGVAKAATIEVPNVTKTIETDRQKVERIAKVECEKRGLGDFCVQDMLGIAYAESRFNCQVIGDGGKSHGCFQIHRGYHKDVTVEQARDVQYAIDWTLNRLVKNQYPVMRSVSIMKHNGTPGTVKTKAYLATVNYFVSTLK